MDKKDIPNITTVQFAGMINRDRHTAWHHICKHGFNRRKIAGSWVMSANECDELIGKMRLHNIK